MMRRDLCSQSASGWGLSPMPGRADGATHALANVALALQQICCLLSLTDFGWFLMERMMKETVKAPSTNQEACLRHQRASPVAQNMQQPSPLPLTQETARVVLVSPPAGAEKTSLRVAASTSGLCLRRNLLPSVLPSANHSRGQTGV